MKTAPIERIAAVATCRRLSDARGRIYKSALPPHADIRRRTRQVRFELEAEIAAVFIRLVRRQVTSMMLGSSDQEPLRSSD